MVKEGLPEDLDIRTMHILDCQFWGGAQQCPLCSLVLRVTVISALGGAASWGAALTGFVSPSTPQAPLCEAGLELRMQVRVAAHSQAVDKS